MSRSNGESPAVPREDPENDVAAARFAIIQGRRRSVDLCGRQARRRRRVAFDETAKRMLRYPEHSEDFNVGVTELQEQLQKSEEAGVSIRQIAQQAMTENSHKIFEIFGQGEEEERIASLARWNAQLKGLAELKEATEKYCDQIFEEMKKIRRGSATCAGKARCMEISE